MTHGARWRAQHGGTASHRPAQRLGRLSRYSAPESRFDRLTPRAAPAPYVPSPNLSPTRPHRVTSDGRVGTRRIRSRTGRHKWAWAGSPRTFVKPLITRRSRVQIPPPPPSRKQRAGATRRPPARVGLRHSQLLDPSHTQRDLKPNAATCPYPHPYSHATGPARRGARSPERRGDLANLELRVRAPA